MEAFAKTSQRPRRTAKARREQRARADARTISRIVKASVSLAEHRGCQPGQYLSDLADLLVAKTSSVVNLHDENHVQRPPEVPDVPPLQGMMVPVSRLTKPRPCARARPGKPLFTHEAGLLEESFDSDKDDQSMPENLYSVGDRRSDSDLEADLACVQAEILHASLAFHQSTLELQEAEEKVRRLQAVQNLPRAPLVRPTARWDPGEVDPWSDEDIDFPRKPSSL